MESPVEVWMAKQLMSRVQVDVPWHEAIGA
jgi:hypothetical protein